MNDFFRFTKYKLVLSYLLFFAITIAATYFIYEKSKSLASPSTEEAQIRQKSHLVNGILLNLFRIEEMSRRTIIHSKANTQEMKSINTLVLGTNVYLDSLISMTDKEHQHERLESIKLLLSQKQNNINTLVSYIEGVKPDLMYRKSMNDILDVTNDNKENINVVQREVVKYDTLTIKPKQKKFLQRIAEVFSPSKQDSLTQIVSSVKLKSDTVVGGMVSTKDTVQKAFSKLIKDIRTEQEVARKEVLLREKRLSESNQQLTNTINQLLFEFEEEEIQNTLQEVEASHVVLKEIVVIAILMTLIAFVIGFVSLVFITRDIARSQRYRKELESEKALTENLLKSREQLILSITHDIKSPLNSILGYLQIIREGGICEQEMVRNMMSSSSHILDLVNSLLDFNRLEKGIIEKKDIPFNARTLFQDIFLSFEPAAHVKMLAFDLKMQDDIDSFKGDDFRIRQITSNLLSNAIKYTNSGSVTLTVNWEKESEDNGTLLIEVSDTGRGLNEVEKEQILQEFCRLADHKNIEGLGLGLSITQKLIALLGGTLRIDSMINEGTKFVVSIPLLRVDRVAEDMYSPDSCINVLSKHLFHILLVDDDSIQLNMVKMLLEKRGYNVTATLDPKQVIPLLGSTRFDLLITDIQMRNLSGLELVEQVRKMYPKSSPSPLRIVALSGISYLNEQELVHLGFDAMINKPVSTEKLLSKIHLILKPSNDEYDLGDLIQFALGDRELEQELVDTFLSESIENMVLLKRAIEQYDLESLCGIAHKMKSSFKMIHADLIADILLGIEKNKFTQQELLHVVGDLIERIEILLDRISAK